jgi:Na+-driven multidrug efflux pump
MKKHRVIDYALPSTPRKRFRPLSIWILIFQLPYAILLALLLPEHGKGDPKRLLADSVNYLIFCVPVVLAIGAALWEIGHSRRHSEASRRLTLTWIALVLSSALLFLAVAGWYRVLWLDPHGRWP